MRWPQNKSAWDSFLASTGLVPEVAVRALYLAWYAQQLEGVQLEIESAYRSPAHQLELQRRWDAGNRVGLKVRPASSSRHTEGRAFDVRVVGPAPRDWEALGKIGEAFGLKWGGRFRDRDEVHFEL